MQGLAASVRSTALGGAQSCVFLAFARRGATVLSAMALALTATAGCGSHESSGTGPTAPSAPSPTVTFLSLVLSGGSAFTGISETSQLVATARLSDNTERTVTTTATWQSSKTEVATVSSSGLVSTTGPGQARITATHESKSASVDVAVPFLGGLSRTVRIVYAVPQDRDFRADYRSAVQ